MHLHCSYYTTVSFHYLYPIDDVAIQKESSMVFWCSINWKCRPTMSQQDKPNLAISGTFRLRGWKLIWQHAFKRQPGATGHTWANMCFCVSPVAAGFNYYILGLFGPSVTLGCSLWLIKIHIWHIIKRVLSYIMNISSWIQWGFYCNKTMMIKWFFFKAQILQTQL